MHFFHSWFDFTPFTSLSFFKVGRYTWWGHFGEFYIKKKKSQKIFFFRNDDDMQEKRSHCSGRSGGGDNDIAGICRSDAIQFTADCNRIADRHVAHEPQSKSSCGHACLKPGACTFTRRPGRPAGEPALIALICQLTAFSIGE